MKIYEADGKAIVTLTGKARLMKYNGDLIKELDLSKIPAKTVPFSGGMFLDDELDQANITITLDIPIMNIPPPIENMEKLGWKFYQDCPEGGQWFLFDEDGNCIAKEGSDRWKEDFGEARKT